MGAITYTEGAAPASSTASKGTTVILQDFAFSDPTLGGAWKDEKGSRIDLSYKPAKKRDHAGDKALVVHYNMALGGHCGFWYRAGNDPLWRGVDCSKGRSIQFRIYTSKPAEFTLSLEDINKLKFEGGTPTTTGGKWETLTLSLTGLPKDFGVVKTFNLLMKTPGDITLSIDQIAIIK
jgi:hypothetical protein